MKKELSIIALLIVGALPLCIFGSTLSQEVTSDINLYTDSTVKNVTLYQWNPLLGNQYVILIGGEFISYIGVVNGNLHIYDKSTGINSSYSFFIDATSSLIETQYAVISVELPPGEYIFYYDCDVYNIAYHVVAKGWLMNISDLELMNLFQYIAIGLSVLLLLAIIIVLIKRNRKN